MNNGKVRIYELSKELNLDNKDILAVCEQLNIAVKSHSSTITEDEAERIRAAAEKYSASHSSPPHRPTPASTGGGQSRGLENRPIPKKQQILEIRRNPTSVNPNSSQSGTAAMVKPQPQGSGMSSSSGNQSAQPPVRPMSPKPPVRPTSAQAPTSTPEENPELEGSLEAEQPIPDFIADEPQPTHRAEQRIDRQPTEQQSDRPVDRQVERQPESAPAPSPRAGANRPQLVAPPSRPAAGGGQSSGSLNPPLVKRVRTESAEGQAPAAKPVEAREATTPQGASNSPAKLIRKKVAQPSEGGEERSTPKPQSAVELRRPQLFRPNRPTPATGPGKSTESEDGDVTKATPLAVGDDEEMRLRRPTPPRLPRKGKTWEEEEEEGQEPKVGKAGAKSKRRQQPLLEDDIDFIEEELDDLDGLSNGPAPAQISLSLARPAKPRSKPGQIRPVTPAASMGPRAKKSGDSRAEQRHRRDREEEKQERPTKVTLTGSVTVQELAALLVVPETEIIRTLFFKGVAANINQTLDISTASMVAQELGVEAETGEKESEARKVVEMLDAADLENLQRRPPVVTIMGHVDHGKTTLLDSIRKTKVAQGEAGGITQHIGAYHVDVPYEGRMQQVVFLDTPGHEAFTAMRARGARVTDVAILVVAADDGVQPQTIEAISHAKAAEVPIIVAINKIDKEDSQPDRVKQELTEFELVPEEWGGETVMVPVSALTGDNLDTLLEMILLVSEVADLHANPDRSAKGTVIEAHRDKSRGPVATLLVQNGTLRIGDVLVVGSAFGKVRAMVDDRGNRVDKASPSFAVEVLGLDEVPAAGDEFEVYQDERQARSIAANRVSERRLVRLQHQQAMSARRITLNTLSAKAEEGELKELNLILKADVQGSLEAILGALQQLPQNEVQIRVLLSAPGEVTETDVDLAAASSAVILGFNTTLASGARQAADQAGVDIREYNIIYKLLDDIQGAMEGLLEPELVEEALGQTEVRAIFPVGRGSVAGCYVRSGKMIRNCNIRVRRNGNIVHEGILDSLKRMKEDAKEVNAGYECGVGVGNFNAWEMGDIIEAYRMVAKRRTLSAN